MKFCVSIAIFFGGAASFAHSRGSDSGQKYCYAEGKRGGGAFTSAGFVGTTPEEAKSRCSRGGLRDCRLTFPCQGVSR